MPDILDDSFDDATPSPADINFLGEKLVEMADRLKPVALVCPGAQANYAFEVDGTVFRIIMTVEGKAP